jgi:hypothetical protein
VVRLLIIVGLTLTLVFPLNLSVSQPADRPLRITFDGIHVEDDHDPNSDGEWTFFAIVNDKRISIEMNAFDGQERSIRRSIEVSVPVADVIHIRTGGFEDDFPDADDPLGVIDITFGIFDNFGIGIREIQSSTRDYVIGFHIEDLCQNQVLCIIDAPTVARNADGTLEVFARASDNNLWHVKQVSPNTGPWSNWGSLGTPARGLGISNPVVAQNQDGRLEVFIIGGPDRALLHKYQTSRGGPWSNWESLFSGAYLQGTPVVAKDAGGRLHVFVTNDNFDIFHKRQESANGGISLNRWTSPIPMNLKGTPLAVGQNVDGTLELFLYTSNLGLAKMHQDPGGPGGWSRIEQIPFPNPRDFMSVNEQKYLSVIRNIDGRLEVFAMIVHPRSGDGMIYDLLFAHKWQLTPNSRQWSGWAIEDGGKPFIYVETVGQNQDGRLEVFGPGAVHEDPYYNIPIIRHSWQTNPGGGPWSHVDKLGKVNFRGDATIKIVETLPTGGTLRNPEVGQNLDGRLEVFALGSDGFIWHIWQNANATGWFDWVRLYGRS